MMTADPRVGPRKSQGQLSLRRERHQLRQQGAECEFRTEPKTALTTTCNIVSLHARSYRMPAATRRLTITSQIDFLQTLTHGTVGLGLKAGADLQRQTVRIFRISDTFLELANMPSSECNDNIPPKDFAYPIKGRIGLDEMVETFVQLNEYEHLSSASSGDAKSKGNSGKKSAVVPVLSDTFNFQTTLTGSAAPSLTLTPLNHSFHVADASLGTNDSRKDIHKVIVAISLPPSKTEQSGLRSTPGLISGFKTTQPTTAKQRANDTTDDQITRSIINQLTPR
jgi:hypothetical protein